MTNQEIKDKIALLEKELTGEMFQDMDIKDQIHVLQMKLTGTKPEDSHFECEGLWFLNFFLYLCKLKPTQYEI